MTKEVVHSNKVNQLNLKTLNSRELDLFISSLFVLKNKGTDEITLDFSEFKNLAELSNRSTDRLLKSIDAMTNKLIELNNKIILPNGVIRKFNFFRTIDIDPKEQTVRLAVNEDFLYMINDMLGEYTKYSLSHFLQLKSAHSKLLFKQLKQFDNNLSNTQKYYIVSKKDFKEKLNITSNDRSNFSRSLKNLISELKEYFKDLELIKLNKDRERARKGQKIEYLKWTWKNENGAMEILDKTLKNSPIKITKKIENNNKKRRNEIEKTPKEKKVEVVEKDLKETKERIDEKKNESGEILSIFNLLADEVKANIEKRALEIYLKESGKTNLTPTEKTIYNRKKIKNSYLVKAIKEIEEKE